MIAPGDCVRIGEGDVDWIVESVDVNGANLRSGMTGRMTINVAIERLRYKGKAVE